MNREFMRFLDCYFYAKPIDIYPFKLTSIKRREIVCCQAIPSHPCFYADGFYCNEGPCFDLSVNAAASWAA
jgi:hypothetical protein